MGLLAAAGFWVYQKNIGPAKQNGPVLTTL